PISDIVLLTSRGLARLSRLRGMGTAQGLHPRLFITANHQSTLFVHHGCLDVQLTYGLSLGVEVRVVAVQPVNAPMRFQVGLVKGPPNRGPTHGRGMSSLVDQGGSQVIQRPPSGETVLLFGRTTGQGDHLEPIRGGKIVSVVPTAASPEDQLTPTSGSGFATPRRCGDHTETRRRSQGCRDGPQPRPAVPTGIERPEPEGWNRLGPRPLDG